MQCEPFYDKMLNKENLSSFVYKCFIEEHSENKVFTAKAEKWSQETEVKISENVLLSSCKDLLVVTNIAKYRSFQYRLLHRAVLLNTQLHKWGIVETDMCSFCHLQRETYTHFFVMCPVVQPMWLKAEKLMKSFAGPDINFSIETVILNKIVDNAKSIKNYICLVLKQYLYRKRCYKQLPNFQEFKALVLETRNIEFYIAKKNNRVAKHFKKWYNENHNFSSYFESNFSIE